jgi:predicted RNA-binding Zn-ribbon protein involved in translation (DUF1610 family)
VKAQRHHCPVCGTVLVADPIGTPLRCTSCKWHLITLETWQSLSPFDQGFALYMQSSWPTSPIARQKNPYPKGTAKWTAFCEGEQRATRAAQDGEE